MSDQRISAKEQELQALVFEWASQEGLATHLEQIRIKICIVKSLHSNALTKQDWESVFKEGWLPEELKVLEMLHKNGNQPIEYKHSEESTYHADANIILDHKFFQRLRARLIHYGLPFFPTDSSFTIQLKKRVVSPRRESKLVRKDQT